LRIVRRQSLAKIAISQPINRHGNSLTALPKPPSVFCRARSDPSVKTDLRIEIYARLARRDGPVIGDQQAAEKILAALI